MSGNVHASVAPYLKEMNGKLNFVQAVKVLLRKITLLPPNFADL